MRISERDDQPARLSVRGMWASYGHVTAVQGLDLEVRAGEIVALLGPNGAGKTTTLMAIAGFLRPDLGSIAIDGVDVTGHAPHRLARRGLGYVPDDRGLLADLTVRENLALVRNPVTDAYSLFPELHKTRSRRAGVLSGGEQQMLALARVLSSAPRLLLIDELSLGLAPMIVTRLLDKLSEVVSEHDTAVLLVEQHIEQALSYAHRAYVLVHGELRLHGDADELRDDSRLVEESYLGEAIARESH